jgi:mannose-1-phosphate guanylyltransferase / phosphomannomutase
MKAIILAAGKGTRLGDLTRDIPKPMLPINGKPLLEYIILYLKRNGITEIGINLFTLHEQITEYFGDGSEFGVKLKYSYEGKLLGTAGSLVKFEDWLNVEEKFIVIYGDILTNQPLELLTKIHSDNNAFATLLLHRRKESNSYIEMDKFSRIVCFKERPGVEKLGIIKKLNPDGFLVNSAIQILSKEALDYIKINDCFDLPRDVYSKILNKQKIYGFELTGNRIAIDSAERYEQAKTAVKQGIYNLELVEFNHED